MSRKNEIVFHIYGRTRYGDPLEYVDTVMVPDPGALKIPDGENWVELIAFPESAAIQVIPRSEEAML